MLATAVRGLVRPAVSARSWTLAARNLGTTSGSVASQSQPGLPPSAVSTRLAKNKEVSSAQQERLVEVLTASFLAFPEHTDVFSTEPEVNRTLVEAVVSHCLKKHSIYLSEKGGEGGELVGAALWTEPGSVFFTEEEVPDVFGPVMQLLKPEQLEWLVGVMLPSQYELEQRYSPNCSYEWSFGAMLGVHPSAWNLGVGGSIMQEIIKRAGNTPIAFHTQSAKNLHFYGKYGFKLAAEQDQVLPSGKVWADKLLVRRP